MCEVASIFFSSKKACNTCNSVWLRMMQNRQHQRKGKPHVQEKSQGAAVSVEDAIMIIIGLNLRSPHCWQFYMMLVWQCLHPTSADFSFLSLIY
jgi:hypothetical protein